MRPSILVPIPISILLAACASRSAAPPSGPPTVGSPAPAFSLPGSDGKTHSLSEFHGVKPVVIAWFPMAFTGG